MYNDKMKNFLLTLTCLIGISSVASLGWGWSPNGGVWPNQSISYEVNTSSSQELGESATLNIIQESYLAWSSPECAHLSVSTQGVTTRSWRSGDGVNTHIWIYQSNQRPIELSGRETIGVTLSLYRGSTMLDGDILYNGIDHTWTTSPRNQNDVDAQSIITHEVGHQLGLGHSSSSQATMYASYLGGVGPRTLSSDDITGICSLYPNHQEADCDSTRDCAPNQSCIEGQCVLVNETEGQVGDDCSFAMCTNGLVCVQGNSQNPFCTLICEVGDCPTSWSCQTVSSNQGNINLCLPSQDMGSGQNTFGEDCDSGPDCLSGLCVDDGSRTFCTEVCGRDADCPQQAFCASLQGGGGACIPNQSIDEDDLDFGEVCNQSSDCQSNLCVDDGNSIYCSQDCSVDEDCPNQSRCYSLDDGGGACILEDTPITNDELAAYGEACSEVITCQSGLCISDGQSQFCSEYCERDADCPVLAECIPLSTGEGVCIPREPNDSNELLGHGEACNFSDECLSNTCITEDGDNFICVPACQSDDDCEQGNCEMIDELGGYCNEWNETVMNPNQPEMNPNQTDPQGSDPQGNNTIPNPSNNPGSEVTLVGDDSDPLTNDQGCQQHKTPTSLQALFMMLLCLITLLKRKLLRNYTL